MNKIEIVKLSDLRPYFNNPRENTAAVPPVMESIKRFGFIKPIIADREGVIIAGHTRYAASCQLGLQTVPVIYSDLNEEQAKMFRIADNKLAEKSYFDDAKLIEELKALNVPEDMQAFFFESVDDLLSFDYESMADRFKQEQAEYADGDADEELEETVRNVEERNDYFKIKVKDGKRYMVARCPYCDNVEEVEVPRCEI